MALGNEKLPEFDVSSPQLAKDYIIETAYPRGDRQELNFIYNGIRPSDARDAYKGPVSYPSTSSLLCVRVV
ncbi:hypothetical protein IMZ48_29645, partial [Candidatus Bathyarchaeota archaeon]|nr:hypothetical protein [Candidatus Bathyarchaeota archaeon]